MFHLGEKQSAQLLTVAAISLPQTNVEPNVTGSGMTKFFIL